MTTALTKIVRNAIDGGLKLMTDEQASRFRQLLRASHITDEQKQAAIRRGFAKRFHTNPSNAEVSEMIVYVIRSIDARLG